MWRDRKKKNKKKYNDNRINIIIAIVFLFGIFIIFKLHQLQILKHDFYTALALGQHQISSSLEPQRGEIFLSSYTDEKNLHPFATNKDFALLYAVPKDIKNAKNISEKLYIVFRKEQVEKEVEELLNEEKEAKEKEEIDFVLSINLEKEAEIKKIAEIKKRYESINLEAREIKRTAEIEIRRKKIIEEYLSKLGKKNDPYEPLEKKVDEDTLKKLYASLLSNEFKKIKPENLKLKEGKIFFKKNKEEIKIDGISYTMINRRFYPEKNIGSHIMGFVSHNENKKRGNYGLEGFFDEELFGVFGSIKSERGADRKSIIINDREYITPLNGDNLILTIDRSIEYNVCQKLNNNALRHGADGGSVIIVEPKTGAIVAMCSWPDFDPNKYEEVEDIKIYNNPAIFSQYEPGSVFKTITMAAALDQEKINPETIYHDDGQVMVKGWPKPIKNSDFEVNGPHGWVDMNTVLEESLNTGVIFAQEKIGKDVLAQYVKKFGFGEKTGIELETENAGNIKNLLRENIREVDAATVSFGQGLTVTPLQMLMSYAAIANHGILMKPYLVKEIIHTDGSKEIIQPRQVRQVISARAATLVSGMMVNVIEGGHAKRAGVAGYYIGGKTGTAQVASKSKRGYGDRTIHTFVGIAPIEEPKFVMLVKLDDPKDVQFSASSAAPLFGEIADFLLKYYQIPKERRE